MGQAARLASALKATPEDPGPKRLCQDCHERAVAYRGLGVCRRCYLRRERRSTPIYQGSCRWAGCPKAGRGRSGYCRNHYQQGWHRAERWRRVLTRQLGTSLTVDEVRRGLEEAAGETPLGIDALEVVRNLIDQVASGQMTVMKSPWRGRRA